MEMETVQALNDIASAIRWQGLAIVCELFGILLALIGKRNQ